VKLKQTISFVSSKVKALFSPRAYKKTQEKEHKPTEQSLTSMLQEALNASWHDKIHEQLLTKLQHDDLYQEISSSAKLMRRFEAYSQRLMGYYGELSINSCHNQVISTSLKLIFSYHMEKFGDWLVNPSGFADNGLISQLLKNRNYALVTSILTDVTYCQLFPLNLDQPNQAGHSPLYQLVDRYMDCQETLAQKEKLTNKKEIEGELQSIVKLIRVMISNHGASPYCNPVISSFVDSSQPDEYSPIHRAISQGQVRLACELLGLSSNLSQECRRLQTDVQSQRQNNLSSPVHDVDHQKIQTHNALQISGYSGLVPQRDVAGRNREKEYEYGLDNQKPQVRKAVNNMLELMNEALDKKLSRKMSKMLEALFEQELSKCLLSFQREKIEKSTKITGHPQPSSPGQR
jgi:hypothetical protein